MSDWKKMFELKSAAVERWVPCSDHRDKVDARKTGCPYCMIEHLRKEIETLGDLADVCAYDVLGTVCNGCRSKCPHYINVE